jgi:ribosomal protein S18 acetylase RimI-like enzyme
MDELLIRPATVDDLDALKALLTALHDTDPWESSREGEARSALDEIVRDDRRCLLVAFADGRPVGTLDIIVVPNLTRGARPFAVVENVVVLPESRRAGVGRQLMQTGLDFARERGCYKVQLVSANKRDAAHHLYRAMGFDADVGGYRRYLLPVEV